MDKLKNEQGYALVTVLLIIVIFSLLFLSFAGQSFSSVKQNQITESSSQSVALAEMGINYYKTVVQQTYESQKVNVNQALNQSITNTGSTLRTLAASLMAANIQQQISNNWVNLTVHPIDGNSNASFSLTKFTAIVDPSNSKAIKISYSVMGTNNGASNGKTLDAIIAIDLSSITYSITPTLNKVNQPLVYCQDLTCNQTYINGNANFTGNNNNLNNKTVYATGSLSIDGNANNSVVQLHSGGPLTIGGNVNSLTDSIIETYDSATFYGNLKINSLSFPSSSLLVGKDLSTGNHLTLEDISNAYVGGNATLNDLDISSTSKMCVQGNLSVTNDITGNNKVNPANLFVLGTVADAGANITNYTVSLSNFISGCSSIVPLNIVINWGNSIKAIVTSVNYN